MRGLTDRRAERGVLDGLAEAARAGDSRVLVVHGEPGVGKTTPHGRYTNVTRAGD